MRILLFSTGFLLVLSSACGSNSNKQKQKELSIDDLYKKYPDSVPILIKHGNLMLERYDYEKAMQDGAKAYRMQESNIEARFLYANALNNQANRTPGDVMSAQKHFKFVVKKQPKNTRALVALATTYAQQGDNEKAFYYTNEALRIDKKYRDAYILKGSIYLSLGNRKLAKSSYQTAIEQDPEFFAAYIKLGLIYQEENNPLCIQYFITATQIRPNNIEAYYNLAYAYQQFDKISEAQQTYREMLEKDPTFTPPLFQLGWIKQFKQNDLDSATYFYNKTLQKEPRYVEAWHNLGLIYETKGEKYLAIQYYRKALKYNPDFTISNDAIKRLSK
ncbi:tetratricopeptide repeat protein [Fluviicola sp.]|jgi:Tfp pilus assembly protein PilF|uniref:tetratricopeptide repeat protein n=1 Tax=Fluviicola sp. TaxID=1917219 RepID=UPI002833A2B1|nr:tetratricopeptide repeat protein [Fluviicola sp.]MDR0802635.1 tetratricopeptide repeat protein [Fluviicola sp.]